MENSGTQVDIGGVANGGGDGGGSGDGAIDQGDADDAPGGGSILPAAPPCVPSAQELCRGNYTTARLPDVTMNDLASFRPASPSMTTEPAGVGIVGMPVNLVTAASVHQVPGDLFGYAVTVRFTPTAFVFDAGDGSSRRTATGGATWETLGQADFTPTATSHTYTARGTYTATASVEYVAHVDFGAGWRDVPGTLVLSSPGQSLRIVEASTALVERTCVENPSGPGC